MTVLLSSTLTKLKSYLQASGYFDSVTIGEPTDPPTGRHGAVMLNQYTHPGTTANGTLERRYVNIRMYKKAFAGDAEAELTELWMDEAVAKIQEDLLGDFDLGATVRAIFPTEMTTRFGYQSIGGERGVMYRLADITVPMDVDDSAAYVA